MVDKEADEWGPHQHQQTRYGPSFIEHLPRINQPISSIRSTVVSGVPNPVVPLTVSACTSEYDTYTAVLGYLVKVRGDHLMAVYHH